MLQTSSCEADMFRWEHLFHLGRSAMPLGIIRIPELYCFVLFVKYFFFLKRAIRRDPGVILSHVGHVVA